MKYSSILWGVITLCLLSSTQAKDLFVIDIGYQTSDVTLAQQIAVLSCQGLMNRNEDDENMAVYTIKEGWDQNWLDTYLDQNSDEDWELLPLSIDEYLLDVCSAQNFTKILYSKSTHHEVIPQIITLAGVLDAVPLDSDSGMDSIWMDHDVAFDAAKEFLGFTELEATRYIFENHGYETTGVSMMNPGWRQPDNLHPVQHELVRDPSVGLTDFIVKERIFNFFLYAGCVPTTEEHELMRIMMTDTQTVWKKPVEVYGYNDAVDIFGGWVFEAETNCLSEHNMGQVASSGQNDFSFFNKKSIQSPDELQGYLDVLMKTRQDISDGNLVYDPSKTYMTFIVGDGDNVAFMKGGRRGWMNERVQHCQEFENKKCDFPLSWSISPHLLYLAPDWLHWYYAQANVTGQDVFVLPPSGHLYAYPGMMQDDSVRKSFVESTQEDCNLLTATGSVHWEWFYGWTSAFNNYFPEYSIPATDYSNNDNSNFCVRSFFATNVPYNFYPNPIEWPLTEHFRVLEGDVIVFKPREWRGTNADGAPIFGENNYLTETEMAAEINGYKKGTVSHLYLTSDGGMNLGTLYKMVAMLDDHVKVVNHEELTEMARQKVLT